MIDTFSAFYFGQEVTSENLNIPFDEGAGEVNAKISVGSYTLSSLAAAIQSALNIASITTVFTVTVDRTTRKYTITGDVAFDLLVGTGTTIGSSAFELMGFTGAADLTGLTSYEGDSGSGSEYFPQIKLQSYVPKENNLQAVDASVNESSSGVLEIIRFGTRRSIKMDMKFITSLTMDGKFIKNNATGLEEARVFFEELIKRNKLEFMPDADDRDTFSTVILEKIPGNSKAVGYELKELFSKNLRDIYEINGLEFRVAK